MALEDIQIVAGIISTFMFVGSNLPMLWKAFATKNLSSYSLGHIGLSNAGNLIYWLYLFTLPVGPVWFLHGFNTLVAGLMLFGYLRYQRHSSAPNPVGERRRLSLNHKLEPRNPVFGRVCLPFYDQGPISYQQSCSMAQTTGYGVRYAECLN